MHDAVGAEGRRCRTRDGDSLTQAFLADYRKLLAHIEGGLRQPEEPEARRRSVQAFLGRLLFRRFLEHIGRRCPDDDGPPEPLPEAQALARQVFARYPVTAAESPPQEGEVALDPGVLGTVLEESLAGRYERGTYYTPCPLAAFMCREALKCYLAGATADGEAVARFVDAGDPAGLADPPAAAAALRRVRVCDPACGSGAFLLGMLHELDRLRAALDPVEVGQRRLEIVGANLHGLDLEPLAVDTARRRLWLAVAAAGGAAPPWSGPWAEVRTGDGLTADAGTGTFDIVLTNPPYRRMELLNSLQPMLRRNFPEVYAERADLYVYFYARAQRLLHTGGVGCLLSSNRWLRAGYGEGLRRHLLDAQAVRLVVDFGELPVFRAATFPAVVLWQRRPRGDTPTRWATVTDLGACYQEGVREHVERRARTLPASHFGGDRPRLLAPAAAERRRRMEARGPCLAEVLGRPPCRGVVTGLNAAFVVDRPTRDRLLADEPGSAAVLRPLLTGDDVRRYEVHFRGVYLLYLAHGSDLADHPALRRHLEVFRPRLERRARRQAWFRLQQPQAAYVPLFEAAKIVYPVIGTGGRFALDAAGYYPTDKVFFLPSADGYLLGVLNSAAALEYLRGSCPVLGDAGRGGRLEFRASHLRRLPIPDAPERERRLVRRRAEEVQALHDRRRGRVEEFLRGLGSSADASGSRNPLEQPWRLTLADCRRRARGASEAVLAAARDETAALTDDILRRERALDEHVAALYGLQGGADAP
jgi:hypothetical protein